MVDQPGNDGDEKGGGLAGAGLRPAAGILAGEGAGEDFRLDGVQYWNPRSLMVWRSGAGRSKS